MEIVQLNGGREVGIRSVRSDDAARLQEAHARLSPESRYNRFMAPKPHLSTSEARYLVDVDGRDHVALIATVRRPGGGEDIVAVARFVRMTEDPGAAEFAIVVGDLFQREGLGSILAERLADVALERGIERFRATMLADNLAIHRLVARLARRGLQHRARTGAIDEMEFELAA